ncbi:MAG: hypothetical protein ACYTGB_16560, partial [Planctomycetota bacterium]
MSSRERWLAALDGESVDRLPFWPKVGGPYAAARTGRFAGASAGDIHGFLGSDLHEGSASCVRTVRKNSSERVEPGDSERVKTFETPHGRLRGVSRHDAASASWHPVEFPVK